MATDPVCGMFVEEKPDSIQHTVDGRKYYFCSTQCLNEFTEPERELKRLKRHVAISIVLTMNLRAESCSRFLFRNRYRVRLA